MVLEEFSVKRHGYFILFIKYKICRNALKINIANKLFVSQLFVCLYFRIRSPINTVQNTKHTKYPLKVNSQLLKFSNFQRMYSYKLKQTNYFYFPNIYCIKYIAIMKKFDFGVLTYLCVFRSP